MSLPFRSLEEGEDTGNYSSYVHDTKFGIISERMEMKPNIIFRRPNKDGKFVQEKFFYADGKLVECNSANLSSDNNSSNSDSKVEELIKFRNMTHSMTPEALESDTGTGESLSSRTDKRQDDQVFFQPNHSPASLLQAGNKLFEQSNNIGAAPGNSLSMSHHQYINTPFHHTPYSQSMDPSSNAEVNGINTLPRASAAAAAAAAAGERGGVFNPNSIISNSNTGGSRDASINQHLNYDQWMHQQNNFKHSMKTSSNANSSMLMTGSNSIPVHPVHPSQHSPLTVPVTPATSVLGSNHLTSYDDINIELWKMSINNQQTGKPGYTHQAPMSMPMPMSMSTSLHNVRNPNTTPSHGLHGNKDNNTHLNNGNNNGNNNNGTSNSNNTRATWACLFCREKFQDKITLRAHTAEGHPHQNNYYKSKNCTDCGVYCPEFRFYMQHIEQTNHMRYHETEKSITVPKSFIYGTHHLVYESSYEQPSHVVAAAAVSMKFPTPPHPFAQAQGYTHAPMYSNNPNLVANFDTSAVTNNMMRNESNNNSNNKFLSAQFLHQHQQQRQQPSDRYQQPMFADSYNINCNSNVNSNDNDSNSGELSAYGLPLSGGHHNHNNHQQQQPQQQQLNKSIYRNDSAATNGMSSLSHNDRLYNDPFASSSTVGGGAGSGQQGLGFTSRLTHTTGGSGSGASGIGGTSAIDSVTGVGRLNNSNSNSSFNDFHSNDNAYLHHQPLQQKQQQALFQQQQSQQSQQQRPQQQSHSQSHSHLFTHFETSLSGPGSVGSVHGGSSHGYSNSNSSNGGFNQQQQQRGGSGGSDDDSSFTGDMFPNGAGIGIGAGALYSRSKSDPTTAAAAAAAAGMTSDYYNYNGFNQN